MENLNDKIKAFLNVDRVNVFSHDYCPGPNDGTRFNGGTEQSYEGSGGDSNGIKEWNGRKVYLIDCIPTIIDSVHGNYAKGYILNDNFTVLPCYIAKVDGQYYAHGKTLHKAFADAMIKSYEKMPIEERIENFIAEFPDKDMIVANSDLFAWHNRLTGSCEMGRRAFAADRNIDVDNGSMTVTEFINFTQGAYGGEVIKELKKKYEQ